jgi:flagellar hook-basal body complex protein FliE
MESRDEYVQKLKSQIDEWNAEMAKWETRARQSQDDMRAEYEKRFEDFRQQRDAALEQMRQMQNAAGDAWTQFVRGTDEAWKRASEAFDKAFSPFRK